MLRWLTSGESHGEALVGILDGLPAGVALTTDDVRAALARRRLGYGRGSRQKFEQDELRVLGGLRHGATQGGPLAIEIANSEWPKWVDVMSSDPCRPRRCSSTPGRVTSGRSRATARSPGRAPGTPTSSACASTVSRTHDRCSSAPRRARPRRGSRSARPRRSSSSRPSASGSCRTSSRSGRSRSRGRAGARPRRRRRARRRPGALLRPGRRGGHGRGDRRVPEGGRHARRRRRGARVRGSSGLGTYAQSDRRLDARLAAVLMGIQAIKGVEVGDGFRTARAAGPPRTTRSSAAPTVASTGAATAPAGSRAACRTARWCACAPP